MSKEIDPYKKVWNSVEDHESILQDWAKNGTLFVPTWEEIGLRYVSRSKALLAKARSQESKAAGKELFQDALFYRNMAEKAFEQHQVVLSRSR